MADDKRLVRVTRHKVGYLYLNAEQIERAVTGRPDASIKSVKSIDGDLLCELPRWITSWVEDYPTAELVTFDKDGNPEGVADWHELPQGGDDRG